MATMKLQVTGTYKKIEYFDDVLGKCCPPWNKAVRSPLKLCFNGKYGEEAFAELQKPVFGPEGNKPFAELIPFFAKAPMQTITTSNYRKLSEIQPPSGVLCNARKSIGLAYLNFQPRVYDAELWAWAQVEEWKLASEPEFRTEPNPEYQVFVDKKAEFLQLLANTFEIHGKYQFPAFPVLAGAHWFLNDAEIPQDPAHPLAGNDGWVFPYKNMAVPAGDIKWEAYVSVMFHPAPFNVKRLLGIV